MKEHIALEALNNRKRHIQYAVLAWSENIYNKPIEYAKKQVEYFKNMLIDVNKEIKRYNKSTKIKPTNK